MVRRLAAGASAILITIAAAVWPGLAQAQQPANPKAGSAVAAVAAPLVERGACTGIAVGITIAAREAFTPMAKRHAAAAGGRRR